MKILIFILSLILGSPLAHGKCVGKFPNPITDICWSCLFPITIAGLPVVPQGEDTPNSRSPICTCSDPFPRVGIPISFWEPARMVDVTRTPYCLMGLGGIQVGPSTFGHGTVGRSGKGMKHSFYQVHWYIYPLMYWLELLTDFACMEKASFDVAYLTELDPFWSDDELNAILNPEAGLFGNMIAQGACAVDCLLANSGFPKDSFFWCGGCQGSMYPFTGSVEFHSSPIQASLLLVERFIAKLHREGLAWGYTGIQGLCGKYPMPIIQKTQYKNQMIYPSPSKCFPLGRSDILWSSGKSYPVMGEDFQYLVWRKRNCCLL